MYIYAEYLLLENFVINYVILYITKKFTRTETGILRLVLAASLGALYTLVVFFPTLRFMTRFVVKFSISILIIIVAFNPLKLNKFIKLIATFYIVSFVFAGAALALFYFTETEVVAGRGIFYIKDFPWKLLALAVVISWFLIKFPLSYIQTRIRGNQSFIPITIELNNKMVNVIGLLDTGNSLKDPITEAPVIVVQFSAIKDLLPRDIQDIFLKYKENNLDTISEIMSNTKNQMKFRLIPFRSLGKENGMLLGFKPDKVILKEEEEEKERNISEIIIGIYNSQLSSDDKYTALLHPEVLN